MRKFLNLAQIGIGMAWPRPLPHWAKKWPLINIIKNFILITKHKNVEIIKFYYLINLFNLES